MKKCKNCGGILTSPKGITLKICPFCQTNNDKPITATTGEEHLRDAFLQDNSIYKDKTRLKGLINDRFAAETKLRKRLRIAVDDDIADKIIKMLPETINEQKIRIANITQYFAEEYNWSVAQAAEDVQILAFGAGVNTEVLAILANLAKPQPTAVNNPKPTKPQPATVSNPQPQKPQPTAVSNPQPQKPQPTAVSNPQPQKPQPAAFSNPKPTKPPKNKHSPKVGDIITFSNYEWRILHVQNKQALLLSDLVLETRPYNIKNTAITWEKCSLRYYLNNDFYNKLSDKSQITQKTIVNDDHPEYGIFGGNRTTDRIFLLSLEEVVNYFGNGNSDMSILKNDGYISDKNNSKRIARDTSGAAAWWWLRSPGYFSGIASFVSNGGVVNVIHYSVSVVGGVRPALWINL